ncbi:hypothetical protein [Pseudoalteromonas gelatinilytica]
MENIILFCLIVGVGSTIALDVWGVLVKTITRSRRLTGALLDVG